MSLAGRAVNSGPSPRVRGEHRPTALRWRGNPGHPRACGENVEDGTMRRPPWRAIPARAGRTPGCLSLGKDSAGHPRACGENCCSAMPGLYSWRAIPARAGRTASGRPTDTRMLRAIPARAGRTIGCVFLRRQAPGHPRACGENPDVGEHRKLFDAGHPRACGENLSGICWAVSCCSGHPRACGENAPRVNAKDQAGRRAIPARAGRTVMVRRFTAALRRAIPARAGRTATHTCRNCHGSGPSPRVRGEPPARPCPVTVCPGHPRACGENGRARSCRRRLGRAIPARAGRTAAPRRFRSDRPGHPRACGENGNLHFRPIPCLPGHPRACGENRLGPSSWA